MTFRTGVSGVPGQGDEANPHTLSRITPDARSLPIHHVERRGAGVSLPAIRAT